MTKTLIRNQFGTIEGYVETDSNGDQRVFNPFGILKAVYVANRDVTTNPFGTMVSQGNTAITYLYR